MKYIFLLLLLVGATSPHLLIQVLPESSSLGEVEYLSSEPFATQGEWSLELRSDSGRIIGQTFFSPYMDVAYTDTMLMGETWVSVSYRGDVNSVVLRDEQGTVLSSKIIAAICGDAICEENEHDRCSEDCPSIRAVEMAKEEAQLPLENPRTQSWKLWAIGGAILLIIILILILIHMNRTKPHPIQIQY